MMIVVDQFRISYPERKNRDKEGRKIVKEIIIFLELKGY